jgi:hypothetical protein
MVRKPYKTTSSPSGKSLWIWNQHCGGGLASANLIALALILNWSSSFGKYGPPEYTLGIPAWFIDGLTNFGIWDAYLYGSAASLSPSPMKLNARMTRITGTVGNSNQG